MYSNSLVCVPTDLINKFIIQPHHPQPCERSIRRAYTATPDGWPLPMEYNEVYFWTDTIKDWKHLLKPDKYKEIIISSWQELVKRGLVTIYGFVIMPNHLHVVWEMKEPNGKEMPHASFNKYTSHIIQKDLRANHPEILAQFEVDDPERRYRIWQRDPLAVLIDSRSKVEQKIEYMHSNPLQKHWNLADRPEKYHWSSAQFYDTGADEFGMLTHYRF